MTMTNDEVKKLAQKHGILLTDDIQLNEIGLDFRVAFVTAEDGHRWILRIPRRADMWEQIEHEAKLLRAVAPHLSVEVPDWQIVASDLVAYPLLSDVPALTFDPNTYDVTWNIEPTSTTYVTSFARVLVELHRVSPEALHLSVPKVGEVREKLRADVARVRAAIGIDAELEEKYLAWIANDALWPDFTAVVHGDLYAGHVLTKPNGEVTGVIDWSEIEVSDPSIDFAGHMSVFGEESLRALIAEYGKAGGRVWDGLFEQAKARHEASALKYGTFALDSGSEDHLATAKSLLVKS